MARVWHDPGRHLGTCRGRGGGLQLVEVGDRHVVVRRAVDQKQRPRRDPGNRRNRSGGEEVDAVEEAGHHQGRRRKDAGDAADRCDSPLGELALEKGDHFGVGGVRDDSGDARLSGGCQQQGGRTHRDAQPADDARPPKFWKRRRAMMQEVHGTEDVALFQGSHRKRSRR